MKTLIITTLALGMSTTAFANPEPSIFTEANYHGTGSIASVATQSGSFTEPSILTQTEYHPLDRGSIGSAPQVGDSQDFDMIEWFK